MAAGLKPAAPEPEKVRFVTQPVEVHSFGDASAGRRHLSRKALEDLADGVAKVTKRFFDQAIAERDERIKALEDLVASLRPAFSRITELEEKIAELEWELDGFRERADGRVLGMTKEVLEDEP